MKILNERELKGIANNHSLDIDSKDFMNVYKICTSKLFSF